MARIEFNKALVAKLGGARQAVTTTRVIRYVAGVVRRERERQAQILRELGHPAVAEQLVDQANDPKIFRWAGADVPMDGPTTREDG